MVYDGGLGTATQTSAAGVTTFTTSNWVLTVNNTTGAYSFDQTGAYTHNEGASTAQGKVTVTLTDTDLSVKTVTLTLNIADDVPTAVADAGAASEGQTTTVDAANGVLVNDTAGADGGKVVTTTGTQTGTHGTLTLDADGGYTYVANASVAAGATDVFNYTM